MVRDPNKFSRPKSKRFLTIFIYLCTAVLFHVDDFNTRNKCITTKLLK